MRLHWAVVLATLLFVPGYAQGTGEPVIRIHDGKHWTWYARKDQFEEHRGDIEKLYGYADAAFERLCANWGLKPPSEKYALLVMEKPGGGFASGDIREVREITGKVSPGIGLAYDAFFNKAHGIEQYWAYVLITHEMVNVFTGQIVSGGWPVDWWANHRSPFPLMTAVQIEYALVPQVAIVHERQRKDDPLIGMFLDLKDQYGWSMFRRAFATAVADGVQWNRLGRNPSRLRTNYVAAYLQLGAPEDISRFLSPLVPGFDAGVVGDILRARAKWASLPADSESRGRLHDAFLRGAYEECLK